MKANQLLNPFRTAALFRGQTTRISSSVSPKRDCGSKVVDPLETTAFYGHIIPLEVQVVYPRKKGGCYALS